MSAERGWIIPPLPGVKSPHSREAWVEWHRQQGHHPYPAPTAANPERWECRCGPDTSLTAVWRTLTPDQIRQKFSHLSRKHRPPPTAG